MPSVIKLTQWHLYEHLRFLGTVHSLRQATQEAQLIKKYE